MNDDCRLTDQMEHIYTTSAVCRFQMNVTTVQAYRLFSVASVHYFLNDDLLELRVTCVPQINDCLGWILRRICHYLILRKYYFYIFL